MLKILIYFFIGISLSIDAFSLAIPIGTLSISNKKRKELISIIGLFHFIMPVLGYLLGNQLFQISKWKTNYIVSFIYITLSLDLLLSKQEEKSYTFLSLYKIIIIALTVSIDSFAIGIILGLKQERILLSSSIISFSSMLFTYSGLKLGNYLSNKYQEKGKIIGIMILLLLGIKSLFET